MKKNTEVDLPDPLRHSGSMTPSTRVLHPGRNLVIAVSSTTSTTQAGYLDGADSRRHTSAEGHRLRCSTRGRQPPTVFRTVGLGGLSLYHRGSSGFFHHLSSKRWYRDVAGTRHFFGQHRQLSLICSKPVL